MGGSGIALFPVVRQEREASRPDTRRSHHPSRGAGTRARRFDLHLPVWYRAADETEWHTGSTQSVSATGALIRADEPAVPSEALTVVIALPSVDACLVGHGRIVRSALPPAQADPPTFAVSVSRYRIAHCESVLSLIVH